MPRPSPSTTRTPRKAAPAKRAAVKKAVVKKTAVKKAPARKTAVPAVSAAKKGPLSYAGKPWLASYPAGVPTSYEFPKFALTRLLDDAAASFPDHVALGVPGRQDVVQESSRTRSTGSPAPLPASA